MKRWRLIVEDSPLKGSINMARDEAILNSFLTGDILPTLRLYRWNPWCVSLGYFQDPWSEINLDKARKCNVDVIRRPTGGRGVLHAKELTYSIVIGENYPGLPRGVLGSYKYFVRGIEKGLKQLGISPEIETINKNKNKLKNSKHSQGPSPVCFDSPSRYEVSLSGKKIVGSAQMRRKGVILQHGSIKLKFDLDTAVKIFKGDYNKKLLKDRVVGIWDVNPHIKVKDCIEAIIYGFENAFGVVLEEGEYTLFENKQEKKLYELKYNNEAWNLYKKKTREVT